jgi:hypothetical protein
MPGRFTWDWERRSDARSLQVNAVCRDRRGCVVGGNVGRHKIDPLCDEIISKLMVKDWTENPKENDARIRFNLQFEKEGEGNLAGSSLFIQLCRTVLLCSYKKLYIRTLQGLADHIL